ncbi:DoxX family membrane protein [Tetragenococcus solitarius]|uniref:DoxX family protein n=1 Tax=Tetragenococcus solitarius TaxID=71453 RepID=A0ABN3YEM9_9ENTE|nr:DoxX family membrane protein [Tetragenococcus solitarius]
MVKWLRTSKFAMFIIAVLRLYLGFKWALSGWTKITGTFSAQDMLQGAVENPVLDDTGSNAYPWYTEFLDRFVLANIDLFDFIVPWGELLVGLGLIFGTLTTAAAFFGLLMNFSYLLAGTVSINPLFILIQFFILVAGFNAGKIGLDFWVVPFLRKKIPFLKGS